MTTQYRIEAMECCACFAKVSGASDMFGFGEPPRDGNMTLCSFCGTLQVFAGDRLRFPTAAERAAVESDPAMSFAVALLRMLMRGRHAVH